MAADREQAGDKSVAVIIVNWNAGDWLGRVFDGLSRQTFSDFSVVLVDNASTDGSVDRLAERIDGCVFLPQTKNLGFAAANNLAVTHVTCEWIALLNPDAIPEPRWLENLMRAATHNPKASFFGSHQLIAAAPDRLDGIGDAYHISGLAWREGYGRIALRDVAAEPHEIFSPCAAAGLYKRAAFLEVGGFDERYFCYFEDVDLGFRLRLAGHRALYVPDAVVHHGGSVTSGRMSAFSVYHGHRNLVWTFFKNMPADLLWRYLIPHLLMNLLAIVYFALRGHGKTIIKAKLDALKGLGDILRSRRLIQCSRTATSAAIMRVMQRGWPRR